MSLQLTTGKYSIEEIARELYDPKEPGAIVIQNSIDERACKFAVKEIELTQKHLIAAPGKVGRVTQRYTGFSIGEADSGRLAGEYPALWAVRDAYIELAQKIGEHAGFAPNINSAMVNVYPAGIDDGISYHKDQSINRNLIGVCVFGGRGIFSVRERNGTVYNFDTQTGSVLLMRAPRNQSESLIRPEHRVHKVTEKRYVLCLRDRLG